MIAFIIVSAVTIIVLLAAFMRLRFPRRDPVEQVTEDLRRQRIEDLVLPVGDYRWPNQYRHLAQFRYWCRCGTVLTDGPRGGAAVNAVCKRCRINYGDLEGYWGDQPACPLGQIDIGPLIEHRTIGSDPDLD